MEQCCVLPVLHVACPVSYSTLEIGYLSCVVPSTPVLCVLPVLSYLCQARVHAAHGLEVQALGAVDHDDVHAQRFAQVLHRLRLTRASRTLGGSAAVQVKSRGQGHKTPKGRGGRGINIHRYVQCVATK